MVLLQLLCSAGLYRWRIRSHCSQVYVLTSDIHLVVKFMVISTELTKRPTKWNYLHKLLVHQDRGSQSTICYIETNSLILLLLLSLYIL
jgi:hypothetical protein